MFKVKSICGSLLPLSHLLGYQFILKKVGLEEYLFHLDNLNLIVCYLQKSEHIVDYFFYVTMS